MKKEFDIGVLAERLNSVNPKLDFAHEVFLELKEEAIPKGIPDALRAYFTLYIEKSLVRAEEEGRENAYDRESAIDAAASVFEVDPEVAAKFFDQVEEEARVSAERGEKGEGRISTPIETDDDGEYEPSDIEVRRSRRLVRTGEAKKKKESEAAKPTSIKQPALADVEKPDKDAKDLADDQTMEPLDFDKRADKNGQDTMLKLNDCPKCLGTGMDKDGLGCPKCGGSASNPTSNRLYDGLFNSLKSKNLSPNLPVNEAKMGVDYVKSVKTSIKTAVAALKNKDYETAATALDDVADDAGDAARASKKMKRALDAKDDKKVKEAKMGVDYMKSAKSAVKIAVAALKNKDYEAAAVALEDVEDDAKDAAKALRKMKKEVDAKEEASRVEEGEKNEEKDKKSPPPKKKNLTPEEWKKQYSDPIRGTSKSKEVDEKELIKKSDTDADDWNAKAAKKKETRESLHLCNKCTKTFRANESKCTHCMSEDVENIVGTNNIVDAGLMSEDEVMKLIGKPVDEECIEDRYEKMFTKERNEHPNLPEEIIHQIVKDHMNEHLNDDGSGDTDDIDDVRPISKKKPKESKVNEEESDDDACQSCGTGHMRCKKVSQECECDACGVIDKREQTAATAKKKTDEALEEEFENNEEDSTRKIVARGFEDRRDAENTARTKRGTVVVDDTDEKKFMVITKEM